MFERILVPLDGSRFSLRAFGYAVQVAKRFDAEIFLIQVVAPATPVTPVAMPGIESPVTAKIVAQEALMQDKQNLARAKRYLSRKLHDINTQGVNGAYHVVVGNPALAIMKYCQKEDTDLVVMTTHGRGGLRRAIMGSVADQVIRESRVPVLVIRPQTGRKKKK